MSSSNQIDMFAVGPEDLSEKKDWIKAIEEAIDSRSFCLGAKTEQFESQCRDRLGVAHAIGVSSGTDGLKIALAAVGVEPGDEVIVPAYSFFSTASVIAQLGAIPVFVDLDASTLCICPQQVAEKVSKKTRAIMPVHLYGQTAAMDPLLQISEQYSVPIVEDAAQAFDVQYRGKSAGAIGAAGVFSFYPTKNLAAAGDAGMVICQDEEIASRVRLLRVHGDTGGYHHQMLGWNARMDGFQAAVLSVRLEKHRQQQEVRLRNATEYLEALKKFDLLDRVTPLGRTDGSDHCWHQFVVRVEGRDRLREQLSRRGVNTGVYYPSTLPEQGCFQHLGYQRGDFPVAESAAQTVLALPIHHRLEAGDPTRVAEAIAETVGTVTRQVNQ
ncbi:MAG: DegT/DnrJ/EryC1/StrS family aminotransferase [Planctomycetota bacterium]|nr:DegT/DnrJ/EryC1/StrS family aminotransferase [Planctomycetota bacterium]